MLLIGRLQPAREHGRFLRRRAALAAAGAARVTTETPARLVVPAQITSRQATAQHPRPS